MGAKTFRCLEDFSRHGQHIWVKCANPHRDHHGIVVAWEAATWFPLYRFSTSFDGFGDSAYDHFRCTACLAKAGRFRPTEEPPTVTGFFPADDKGWKLLMRRLRG